MKIFCGFCIQPLFYNGLVLTDVKLKKPCVASLYEGYEKNNE